MTQKVNKQVCIAGGGPAGVLLGLLLAKQGVGVLVMERRETFKREFRGETIAAGSVAILDELGLLQSLKQNGFIKVKCIEMYEREKLLFRADFESFKHKQKFGIDIPQPVVLQSIIDEASQYPNFEIMMGTACVELVEQNGEIVGVIGKQGNELFEVRSELVVGADGRHSQLRKMADIKTKVKTFDRDLVWFKLPKPKNWSQSNMIKVHKNKHLIILPTFPDMLRVGTYIPRGGYRETRQQGIKEFRDMVTEIEPAFKELMEQHITSWKDLTMLDIFTAFARQWSRNGLILIGDAAHTLSPVLGQGVNIAMQDAVELSPFIVNHLQNNPGKTVPREALIPFEKKRKKTVKFVQDFQERQEKILAAKSQMETLVRRVKMRALHRLPWKMKVMSKLQHGIKYN
ncbi:FAD-dependent monooxygenase [Lentibacillus cibarius]|uniref:FAD-dependent monooxygenase n=1 Tax=Lentibacillus cibarius TaxID=2583219 RepID=UPI001F2B2BFB|nr:FAD-dependent monooxygenase [Lentibacillus cibarius]